MVYSGEVSKGISAGEYPNGLEQGNGVDIYENKIFMRAKVSVTALLPPNLIGTS